jgi:hypothetical protein
MTTLTQPKFNVINMAKYFFWAQRDPSWADLHLTRRGHVVLNAARIFALLAYFALVGKVETL